MDPTPEPPATAEGFAALSADDWARSLDGDSARATRWLRAAAQQGIAEAQAVLGQWLLDGRDGARDADGAFRWFLQAAAQRHVMGMNMVGRCHENGWGTPVDFFAAANWYRQAARLALPEAMYNLANLLQSGKGVPQDHAAALALYRDAADQGHAKSMTKIGRYYEDGLVVVQDADLAMFCYREGAEGGDFRGQFAYGGMLAARGRMDEALHWLRKVPETATPAYLRSAGELLAQSPHPAIQAVGRAMVARATPSPTGT
jgi:TPR repeat protein